MVIKKIITRGKFKGRLRSAMVKLQKAKWYRETKPVRKRQQKEYRQSPAGQATIKKYRKLHKHTKTQHIKDWKKQPHVLAKKKIPTKKQMQHVKDWRKQPNVKEVRIKYKRKLRDLKQVFRPSVKLSKERLQELKTWRKKNPINKSTGGLIKPKIIKLAKRGWGKIIR